MVLQWYGTADVGSIAYESEAMEEMIVDKEIILKIVHPGTGQAVADGEVGEIVVTTFNVDYPLIRFGIGDLSAVLPGHQSLRSHQCPHQGLDGTRRSEH